MNINKINTIRIFLLLSVSMIKLSYGISQPNPLLPSNIIIESATIRNDSNINNNKIDGLNNINALDQEQSKMIYIKRQIEMSKLQEQLNQAKGVTKQTQSTDIHVIGVMMTQDGARLAQVKLTDGSVLNLSVGADFNGVTIKSITMSGITVANNDCKTLGCVKTSFYHISPVDDSEIRTAPPQDNANPFASSGNLSVPPLIVN